MRRFRSLPSPRLQRGKKRREEREEGRKKRSRNNFRWLWTPVPGAGEGIFQTDGREQARFCRRSTKHSDLSIFGWERARQAQAFGIATPVHSVPPIFPGAAHCRLRGAYGTKMTYGDQLLSFPAWLSATNLFTAAASSEAKKIYRDRPLYESRQNVWLCKAQRRVSK